MAIAKFVGKRPIVLGRSAGQLETPDHYRNRAANVRLEAGQVRSVDLRKQFLRIAEQYEKLADMMETGADDTAANGEAP